MVRARATGGYLLDKSRPAPLHATLLRYPIDGLADRLSRPHSRAFTKTVCLPPDTSSV